MLVELQYLGEAEQEDRSPGVAVHLTCQHQEVLQRTHHQTTCMRVCEYACMLCEYACMLCVCVCMCACVCVCTCCV